MLGEIGDEIVELIGHVMDGKKTKSEELGRQEFSLSCKYGEFGEKNCD